MTCDEARDRLGEYRTGALSPDEASAVTAHLEACAACRGESEAIAGLDDLLAGLVVEPEVRVARPGSRTWGWVAGAAAAVLVAVSGWILLKPAEDPARVHRLPAGDPVAGRDGVFRTSSGDMKPLSLPDGTRLRIGPSGEIRFLAPLPGERFRIELARGSLEAEVAKGADRVRIVSAAGEITVLGTAFLAKAFRVAEEPVLSVEVTEGLVEIRGGDTVHPVPAGRRGIVRGGKVPFATVQEAIPLSWREALARWGKGASAPDFPGRVECLTLLAGRWEGIESWNEVPADPTASPEERKRAAILAGILSDTEREAR